MNSRVINFNAGPSALPDDILKEAQKHLLNYHGSGLSIMEMSHRSKIFQDIRDKAEQRLRDLLIIPNDYEVLFLQGGASLQFSMVPMNLCQPTDSVNLINSGSWTKKAMAEIKKICQVKVIADSSEDQFLKLPNINKIDLSSEAAMVYMASNNTIFGTQFKHFPMTNSVPLVADMSSDILSRRLDIKNFGVIFAGAQKNIGPSGVTIVIIRKDLAERCKEEVPSMLQYRVHIKNKSLYNTPPTFGIYLAGLMFEWIEKNGGIRVIEEQNDIKANLLYQAIDNSDFYYCPVDAFSRSNMNVVFRVKGNHVDVEEKLVKEAESVGLIGLKGHRSVGGLRASIYNAQPLKNIKALINFMETFAKKK